MFGKNIILAPESGIGDTLKINSIFDTIQGEGPYSGVPSIFIRLAGCNLACSFCDTEFDNYTIMTIQQIIESISSYCTIYKKLIVLTGGEPFRQPIEKLCEILIGLGFKIQIETNGLIYREIPKEVEVVCSPKNFGLGYQKIRTDLIRHLICVKFLVSASNHLYNDITNVGQKDYKIKTYIQPIDEYDQKLNEANLHLAMHLVSKYNAILSLQLHKILKIE